MSFAARKHPSVLRGKCLKGEGTDDQAVTLTPQPSKLKEIQHFDKLSAPLHELPEQIKVRFVRVQLNTGEYEVLVTNLMDEIVGSPKPVVVINFIYDQSI